MRRFWRRFSLWGIGWIVFGIFIALISKNYDDTVVGVLRFFLVVFFVWPFILLAIVLELVGIHFLTVLLEALTFNVPNA